MKKQNEMHLTLPAISANESFARTTVAAFAAQLNPTVEEIADIRTAVSEAVTNCIVHAYRDCPGDIQIHCAVYADRTLRVRIRDKGCGIENVAKAMEPLYTTGGEERAGLGFAVMQTFMERVKVRSAPGKGTTVTMNKRIAPRDVHE